MGAVMGSVWGRVALRRGSAGLVLGALLPTLGASAVDAQELVRHDFPYRSQYVEVDGVRMHYVDTGGIGPVVLMIHGQPTWSYLWRNVIPELEGEARVVAMDLIGFGKSERPDIDYTVEDHARYLSGFVDALDLEDVTLVLHDWGSFLGFDYAARHPDRIAGLAFMEALIGSEGDVDPSDPQAQISAQFAELIGQIKTPGVGEQLILEDNLFLEVILPSSVRRTLSADELDAYRAPFAAGSNRLPMLMFPRAVPIGDGPVPEYVSRSLDAYLEYLSETDVPKLMLTFTPGAIVGQAQERWATQHMENLTVRHIGEGLHFVQEDHPEAIGRAIADWLSNGSR